MTQFKFPLHARVKDPQGGVGTVQERKLLGKELAYKVRYDEGGHQTWAEAGLELAPPPQPLLPAPAQVQPITIPPLEAGDVVRLKSAPHPTMTVGEVKAGKATVFWFSGQTLDALHDTTLPVAILERASE